MDERKCHIADEFVNHVVIVIRCEVVSSVLLPTLALYCRAGDTSSHAFGLSGLREKATVMGVRWLEAEREARNSPFIAAASQRSSPWRYSYHYMTYNMPRSYNSTPSCVLPALWWQQLLAIACL